MRYEDGTAEALERFYEESVPDFTVTAERRLPGLRKLRRAVALIQTGGGCRESLVPAVFPNLLREFDDLASQAGRMLEALKVFVRRVKREQASV